MKNIDTVPDNLLSRSANPPVQVLDPGEASHLNPDAFVERIIWGWKRDSEHPKLSRTVYFGGRHVLSDSGTSIENPFLFYVHWGEDEAMRPVVQQLEGPGPDPSDPLAANSKFEVLHPEEGITLARIISGWPTPEDLDRLTRLAARYPEPPLPTPPAIESNAVFDLEALGVSGCDLLAGSGLSYEAGLPMLKEVHDLFWVDYGYEDFCLGEKDRFPSLLKEDLTGMFRRFAGWHTQAATTQPSEAHHCLMQLRQTGFLHNIFTDNIDRLFDLTGIHDYEQVRGSGVVNEFHQVHFHPESNALLVVGVSADRRGIIAQARQRGLKLVVVNPYIPVSPGAKNLDYLRDGDIYYRMCASEALTQIAASTLKVAADGSR